MDSKISDFVYAGHLEEVKARSRLVVHGRHRPVLLVHEDGQVFAFDNRCPQMGFPLDLALRSQMPRPGRGNSGTPSPPRWRE
jgi:nitrite reductase/ring-hydroxylating ferredoxin subunit